MTQPLREDGCVACAARKHLELENPDEQADEQPRWASLRLRTVEHGEAAFRQTLSITGIVS